MPDEEEVAVDVEVEEAVADQDVAENEGAGQDTEEHDQGDPDFEAEFWQNFDKDEADESVPVASHIRLKEKLKGRIKERDSEIDELRRELAEVKAGRIAPTATLKRPRVEEFDTDEEFETALDQYEEHRLSQLAGRTNQAEQLKKQKEERTASVDSHYKRADEFVSKYGIAPEKYKSADESIRKTIDVVIPGQGEAITDHLISLLGEGSEKVLFRVGARPEILREFQSLLAEDKTGLKAGIFLGKQMELVTNPKKRTTNAPPPSRQLKGDAAPNANAAALKKVYQEAHKSGDTQKAYSAKKQARAAGVNVSTW
jgi:hypothetical protein